MKFPDEADGALKQVVYKEQLSASFHLAMKYAYYLALGCILTVSSSDSEVGLRIPAQCKTTNGVPCKFPFIYKDKLYDKCTYVERSNSWCATNTGDDDQMIGNRYYR